MSLQVAQRAFDRLIFDVEREVLRSPMGDGHQGLLRSSFQEEVGAKMSKTTLTPDEIAEKARVIFRHHCWINLLDPRWEMLTPKMIKHMDDVASSQQLTAALPGTATDAANWAPPPPRGRHVKGEPVPCPLCPQKIIAPKDHLAFDHGIDTVRNRYTTRAAHINKIPQVFVVQHLIQDGAELNRLQGAIWAVEEKLKRLNKDYQSKHKLTLSKVYEVSHNHPSFTLSRQKEGQEKKDLDKKLVTLREAGLEQGKLYHGQGEGTYSEVLADLQKALEEEKSKASGRA